jgi:O-antigen/teichoic acid export membrane protein
VSTDVQHPVPGAIAADVPEDATLAPRTILGVPVGATLVMMVLTLGASAVNYGSNLIFSRVLTPAGYGDFTALIALTVIVAVPSGAAQTIVADRLAAYGAAGDRRTVAYLIRHASAHVLVYASVIGLLYCACIPLVSSLMNLQSTGSAIALAPMLVLSFFTPVAFGILQGLERYVALGMVMLWIAVSRILFGVPWALSSFGHGPGGAFLGMAVGNLTALAVVWWIVRHQRAARGTGAARAGLRRRLDAKTMAAGGAFVAFAVLSNFDVVLAKLVLDSHASGEYAALATIEKIVVFLPGAVALLMVPSAAKARTSAGSAHKVLRVSALVVLAATTLVAVPAMVAPHLVIETMFGSDYADASAGVVPIALAGLGLALLYLLVVYTVAINDRRWVLLLVSGMVVQAGAILLYHGSPAEVARAQAVTVWLVLLVNELLFHPLARASRRPAHAAAANPSASSTGATTTGQS